VLTLGLIYGPVTGDSSFLPLTVACGIKDRKYRAITQEEEGKKKRKRSMFVLPTEALVSDRIAALSGDGKTPPPLVPLPTAVDAPGADAETLPIFPAATAAAVGWWRKAAAAAAAGLKYIRLAELSGSPTIAAAAAAAAAKF